MPFLLPRLFRRVLRRLTFLNLPGSFLLGAAGSGNSPGRSLERHRSDRTCPSSREFPPSRRALGACAARFGPPSEGSQFTRHQGFDHRRCQKRHRSRMPQSSNIYTDRATPLDRTPHSLFKLDLGRIAEMTARFIDRHRRTPQEMADLFAQQGFPRDDQGRILHPSATLGGYTLAFDPNKRTPVQGLGACFERLEVCMAPVDGTAPGKLDNCVAGLPRCVSDEPWRGGDPAGDDCCPALCIENYLTARKNGPASAADIFSDSGCYPGIPAVHPRTRRQWVHSAAFSRGWGP